MRYHGMFLTIAFALFAPVAGDPEMPPEWQPGGKYHDGRCCRKMVKSNYIYRWFYWNEYGIIRPNNKAVALGGRCPPWWWTVDGYYCSQNVAEVYNQFDFKEDSDYVLCCYKQAGRKEKYTYFSGKSCAASEAHMKCQSFTCGEYDRVDAADVTCDEGHDKIVNPDGKLYLSHLGGRLCALSTVGMSDADCAGVSPKCTQAYCIGSSLSRDTDCRSHCPGFAEASEKYPERLKHEETGKLVDIRKEIQRRAERRAQAQAGMSPLLIVAGAIVGVIAFGIALMCFRQQGAPKVPANWADVELSQAHPKGKEKGKDNGKPEWMAGQPAAPFHDAHAPMAGPPAMAQFEPFTPTSPCYTPGSAGSAPPSWGYFPSYVSR